MVLEGQAMSGSILRFVAAVVMDIDLASKKLQLYRQFSKFISL
jgi:hypothetical protein